MNEPNQDFLPPVRSDEFLPPISLWMRLGGLFLLGSIGAVFALAAVIKYNVTVKAPSTVISANKQGIVPGYFPVSARTNLQIKKSQIQQRIQQNQQLLSQINGELAVLNARLAATTEFKNSPQGENSFTILSKRRQVLLRQEAKIQNLINRDLKKLQQIERKPPRSVQSSKPVVEIVSDEVPLLVKARVAVQDIGKINLLQKSELRISAYPYTDFGTLKGTVSAFSPYPIAAEGTIQSASETYYEVTIKPEKTYVVKDGRQYPLLPGMEVTAYILGKEETVLTSIIKNAKLIGDG